MSRGRDPANSHTSQEVHTLHLVPDKGRSKGTRSDFLDIVIFKSCRLWSPVENKRAYQVYRGSMLLTFGGILGIDSTVLPGATCTRNRLSSSTKRKWRVHAYNQIATLILPSYIHFVPSVFHQCSIVTQKPTDRSSESLPCNPEDAIPNNILCWHMTTRT